jgi:polyhydroxyalkanoate synthesis regulator phasin
MPAAKKPTSETDETEAAADAGRVEQLLARVSRQLDLVLLSRERIQETLDEAAARGRVTRSDANLLASELVRRSRLGREDLMQEVEALLGRGREGLDAATRLALRSLPGTRAESEPEEGPPESEDLPITGYDELTARQVQEQLTGLRPAELRRVREYERRHANRKTVLEAVERGL